MRAVNTYPHLAHTTIAGNPDETSDGELAAASRVDIDETLPGFVDEPDGALTLAASDDAVNYGVVDEIARRVLLASGRVLAVRREDIPGGGAAAAILLYPV